MSIPHFQLNWRRTPHLPVGDPYCGLQIQSCTRCAVTLQDQVATRNNCRNKVQECNKENMLKLAPCLPKLSTTTPRFPHAHEARTRGKQSMMGDLRSVRLDLLSQGSYWAFPHSGTGATIAWLDSVRFQSHSPRCWSPPRGRRGKTKAPVTVPSPPQQQYPGSERYPAHQPDHSPRYSPSLLQWPRSPPSPIQPPSKRRLTPPTDLPPWGEGLHTFRVPHTFPHFRGSKSVWSRGVREEVIRVPRVLD